MKLKSKLILWILFFLAIVLLCFEVGLGRRLLVGFVLLGFGGTSYLILSHKEILDTKEVLNNEEKKGNS